MLQEPGSRYLKFTPMVLPTPGIKKNPRQQKKQPKKNQTQQQQQK